MCYKCDVCDATVPAGLGQKRHTIYRTVTRRELAGYDPHGGNSHWRQAERQEVARELRVCHQCHDGIKLVGLDQYMRFLHEGKDHARGAASLDAVVPVRAGGHTVVDLKAAPVGELLLGQRRKKNRRKEGPKGNGANKPHPARG